MRTPEQIVARMAEVEAAGTDWLGTQRTDLLGQLPWAHAKPFLILTATEQEWEQARAENADVRTAAVDYLRFALGKVIDHRGISAGRSIDHYAAWLWLLELDTDGLEAIDYPQYGAPKLAFAAAQLGVPLPFDGDDERAMFERMAAGNRCEYGCDAGCGS